MTAVAISEPGGPRVLKPEKRDVPTPGDGEILIRVRAAGVNRPDVQQRKGAYPPPPGASDLPGLEVAGEVAALGDGAKRWRVGDQVCALTPGGGYAEYVAVHETNALPLPPGFTFTEAAALPETFFTVWHNVFQRGGLKAGETLLVHGGSSGIGTTAIQLAAAFGATVIATAGSAEKCAACLKLGADACRQLPRGGFRRGREGSDRRQAAPTSSSTWSAATMSRATTTAAAVEGRIVQIATQGGAVASTDFARLMVKRLTHTGSTLRPRTVEFKGEIAAALEARSGRCSPPAASRRSWT